MDNVFRVAGGTDAIVIADATDGKCSQAPYKTTRDLTFDAGEVVVAPVDGLAFHDHTVDSVGGDFARAGWWGFKRESNPTVLLVPMEHVIEEEENAGQRIEGQPGT